MKKILSVFSFIILIIIFLPIVPSLAAQPVFDKDWNTNNSLPTEVGNYRLTTDVTLTETWQVPEGIVNLDLNCHYIKLADDKIASLITIPGNSTLNIYDNSESIAHKYKIDQSTGIFILDDENGDILTYNGILTGGKGTVEPGNSIGTNGGAVYICPNGTFNLYRRNDFR